MTETNQANQVADLKKHREDAKWVELTTSLSRKLKVKYESESAKNDKL